MAKKLTAEQQEALNDQLHAAADKGDVSAIKQALKDGAEIDARREFQNTPLFWAVRRGHLAAVRAMLEAGAEVDAQIDGLTPMHWAAVRGRKDAAKILLAAGADPTLQAPDQQGAPADCARRDGYTDLANYLQSVVDDPTIRPRPKDVGLDIKKRNVALGKPVGIHTARALAGMEAQRKAALNDPSEGI